MKRSFCYLMSLFSILVSLAGCQAAVLGAGAAGVGSAAAISADPRSSGTVIDDQTLKRKLSSYLNDKYPNNNIEVTVYNQLVLLSGQVLNSRTKAEAAVDAREYPDVKRVYNYLTVGEVQSITQDNKDAWITTKAKATLITTKNVHANDVKIVTTNGVVYIFGVATPKQAKIIRKQVHSIDGVRKVVTFFNSI